MSFFWTSSMAVCSIFLLGKQQQQQQQQRQTNPHSPENPAASRQSQRGRQFRLRHAFFIERRQRPVRCSLSQNAASVKAVGFTIPLHLRQNPSGQINGTLTNNTTTTNNIANNNFNNATPTRRNGSPRWRTAIVVRRARWIYRGRCAG